MRILRPLLWLLAAGAALVGFVAVGRLAEVPLRWGDVGGWLGEASIEDALVEITRWVGMVLAGYVLVVAALVLLVELADAVRAVPAARWLRRLAGVVAVPALRRRLVEASTATAITVSAMSATAGGGVLAAGPAVEQTVDVDAMVAPVVLPAGVTAADVVGFGYDPLSLSPPAPMPPPSAPVETRVVVQTGDTVWDLAVAHYGFCDQSVIDAIALASGLDDPNLIYPGQVLVLPVLPGALVVSPPGAATPVPADGAATWAVYTVVYGDTLWDILNRHYGQVTADLVWSVAAYNGITDPSDLAVGASITLPPLAVLNGEAEPFPPPAPAVSEPPAAPAERPQPAVAPAVVDESDVAPPVAGERETPIEEEDVAAAVDAPPSVVERPVAERSPTSAAPTADAAVDTPADEGAAVAPWLVGLAGTTSLAVGLLAVYRRLRRRQAAAGARAWRLLPLGPSAELHRQLVAAADVPLVRWAGQELSGVLFELGRPVAGPVAVELSEATGLELLWDAPMPDAPTPWEATDNGWAWRLLYDPAAEVPEAALPAAVPGLVTLGRRDTAQVLVDLEAYGSLAITGDPRAAEDVLRSVVLEYGAGDELSDAWVSTVGLGVDGVEHLGRVQVRSEQEALTHARGIVADQRRVMDAAGVDSTFVLRASAPPSGREVSVVAVRAASCSRLGELLALAQPRSGLVVIVLGAVDGTGSRLDVDAAGTARLEPFGVTLTAIGVSHEAAANTAVLLDAAAEHATVEDLHELDGGDTPFDDVRSPSAPGIAEQVAALDGPDGIDLVAAGRLLADGDEDDDGGEWERPTPALLVRVLGPPRLDSPVELQRLQRTMVVFVASMGGAATEEAVRTALWGGALTSKEKFWPFMSRVRSRLGAEIVPSREQGSDMVRLVGTLTDLDLLEAMAGRAATLPSGEALALLLEGLELVYGVPYNTAECYQWALDHQLLARATETIEDAALRAVELALAADDVVAARRAVAQALLALPGDELLYRARMRIEHHAGNVSGVRSVYAELVSVLEDLSGDSQASADPSPITKQLFDRLANGTAPY